MSSWWRKARGGLLFLVVGDLAREVAKVVFDAFRRREREKNNKALESKIEEAFQNLEKEIKALHEDFINLKSKESEEIRAELKQIPEQEIARTLESMLNKNLRELSRRIQTLEEDVQKWPETIKDGLQLRRADLEKNPGTKEEEIARTLESKLNENLRELSRRIHTLEEDVKEWPESTRDELQLRRAELKKIPEQEIARTLESMLKKNHTLFSQRTHTLEQHVQECLEATKHEL